MFRILGFHCSVLVQSLVGDVRPHKPYGMAKKKKKDLLASTFEIIN